MNRIGPTRLILLNCGKFDYAQIDLDVPLHLVGPNNIGKTSLIAVLQYLYIDQQNKMRFSRDSSTSRKYYFPDISSFAIFESLGPQGFMLLGVHGLGPVRQYEIERFACQGRFFREDFLDADNSIRSWDEIKATLANKRYVHLMPSDLKAALIGSEGKRRTEINSINLSLVPLNRKGEYDRFCTVFLNLLRLSHLRQEELKSLLLQLFEGDFVKKRIDLQEQFAPQLDQLQRQKTDVLELKRNEVAIRRILQTVSQRDQLRSKLKSLHALIGQASYKHKEKILAQRDAIDMQLQACGQHAEQTALRLTSLIELNNEKLTEKGSLQQKQKDLLTLEKQFCDFQYDWTNARIAELEKNIREIESSLEMAHHESLESIQPRLCEYKREHEQLKIQLVNLDSLFVTSLMENFDEHQISRLSRLFNNEILRLSMQGENSKATIRNKDLFFKYLDSVIEDFDGNVYKNDAVRFVLDNVRHVDFQELVKPERIRQRICYFEKLIPQTEKTLHACQNQQELIRHSEELRRESQDLHRQCAQYQDYLSKKEECSGLEKNIKAILNELETLTDQISVAQEEKKKNEQRKVELGRQREELMSNYDQLCQRIGRLHRPEESWPEGKYDSPASDIVDMIERYNKLSDDQQRLADRIEGELETLHSQTYDRYQCQNERESLDLIQNELDTLEEKEKALEENWTSFIVQLKKDFKELNRDMGKLIAQVGKLNTQLTKVHISNLSNLKISILSRPQLKGYFNQVEDNETTPLFADPAQTDEVIRKISRMLQETPVIALEDMFDMHFEITTPDGETKKYEHLDRIESNGTTIAIKVLINLILLRGLLSHDNVYVPFYLDECSSLDSVNLSSIVQEAKKLGFIAILASPEAMDAADHIYYLSEHNGRVTLNPQNSLVEIIRDTMDDQ